MIKLTELLQCVCVVWSLNNHNYQDSDRKSVCDTPKKSGVVCGRHRWTAAELGLDRELRSFNSDRVERPEFLTAHPFVEGLFYTLHFHQKSEEIQALHSAIQYNVGQGI